MTKAEWILNLRYETTASHWSRAGVKLVMPALLRGAEDKAWRTKQGSIQLLGAMAYCAPKQLSQALPTIVPRLSSVLTDPHPRVQTAARAALDEVRLRPSMEPPHNSANG